MNNSNINIVFVNFGTKYQPHQVNQLQASLKQYCDDRYKFYVYTDNNIKSAVLYSADLNMITPLKPFLPKWWNKLSMFNRAFPVKGKIIYFDIDTFIQGNPFPILEQVDWNKVTLIDSHWKSKDIIRLTNLDVTINSSVMTFDTTNEDIHIIWDHFIQSGLKDYFLRKYVGIDRYIVHESFDKQLFDTFPHDLVLSYKYEDHSKLAPIITCEELDFGSIDFVPISQNN